MNPRTPLTTSSFHTPTTTTPPPLYSLITTPVMKGVGPVGEGSVNRKFTIGPGDRAVTVEWCLLPTGYGVG